MSKPVDYAARSPRRGALNMSPSEASKRANTLESPDEEDAPAWQWPAEFNRSTRLAILWRALRIAAGERRTKRAAFFFSTGLPVGYVAYGWWGFFGCGLFGGSMYFVVLLLRMQRHIRTGIDEELRAAESAERQ